MTPTLCGLTVTTLQSPAIVEPLGAASEECGDNPIEILSLADANGPYAAVQSGRADAYFGDYLQASVQPKEKGDYEATVVPDGTTSTVGIAPTQDNAELAQEMTFGLQEVIDSGEAAEVFDTYGVSQEGHLNEITINAGEIPLDW